MSEIEPNFDTKHRFFSFSKYTAIILSIIGVSFIIHFYYFPNQVPLSADALYYFWYSSAIYQTGELPNSWTPPNNFWPILVGFIFTIFDSKEIFTLMNTQKIFSVLISVLTTIPVYYLCKNFVARKIAIIGASLIAFDPRLIINSFLGITDPLNLLLISISLVLFLSNNKKLVFCSFGIASLAVITRGEGIFFLIALLIIFFIKYRKERYKVLLNYVVILIIISLIIIPISMYRIDTNGSDPIFIRSVGSVDDALVKVTEAKQNDWTGDNPFDRISNGAKTLVEFLIWITIPNFIIFMPLGIFLIFKNTNFEKKIIVIITGVMLIPAFYAYTFPANPALDTRYLYTIFPMLSIFAVLSIEKMINHRRRKNLLVLIIITSIIISSIMFYDYKKIDYDHEVEVFQIMTEIYPKINGVNNLSTESRHFVAIQTINLWPATNIVVPYGKMPELYSENEPGVKIISHEKYNGLESFILNSKEEGLTHIMIDKNEERVGFLKEVFLEESKYPYLKKIYDSTNNGFEYQVKVFEINYELFDSLKKPLVEQE